MKKRKKKPHNLSWHKKKLWTLVSKYARLTHSVNGNCTCYTCGIVKPIKEMQAGHAFSGRGNSILFMLEIIRPQCYGCNCCNSGKLDIFTHKLRNELGSKRFEELYHLKGQIRKFTIPELEEMILDYQNRLEELK